MKTAQKICLALSLTFALSSAAIADPRYRGHYSGHHHHQRGYISGGNAALLTIAGVAIGATAFRYYDPPPVYVPPPRVVYVPPYSPPAAQGTWYFCNSSNQYYPYTRHCPEGWQAVPAMPQ